jgi:hypothetical protein
MEIRPQKIPPAKPTLTGLSFPIAILKKGRGSYLSAGLPLSRKFVN